MIVFRIKQRYDGAWVPDHDELVNLTEHWPIDPNEPFESIRAALFGAVEDAHPGEYTLEYPLTEIKDQKLRAIESRTQVLLEQGFLYNGARYGTSAVDQAYYNLLRIQQYGIVSGLNMQYPVTFASADARTFYSATNSASLALFLGEQASFLRQVRDGDVALKKLVKDATTTAQVEAVTDSR